jgi:hypothetical protein
MLSGLNIDAAGNQAQLRRPLLLVNGAAYQHAAWSLLFPNSPHKLVWVNSACCFNCVKMSPPRKKLFFVRVLARLHTHQSDDQSGQEAETCMHKQWSVFELSPCQCLFRACLGKMVIFLCCERWTKVPFNLLTEERHEPKANDRDEGVGPDEAALPVRRHHLF